MEDVPLCKEKEKSRSPSSTRTLYFLAFIAKSSSFSAGTEMGAMSASILLIQNIVSMRMTPLWKQLILAGALPSAAVFSVIGGCFSDKFGRKKSVMFSCFCYMLGSIITAASNRREVLLIGRLITGAGIGFGASNPSVYVAECSPSHLRGLLIGIALPLFTGGMITADIISFAFSNDTSNGWRYIWGFLAIFNLFQFVGFHFLPESPSWLLRESRRKEAKESLLKLRKDKNIEEELGEIEAHHQQVMISIQNAGGGNLLVKMLKTASIRRTLVVGCGSQLFAEFSGVHTMIYYSSMIIQMSGIGDVTSATLDTGLVNGVTFMFAIVGAWLMHSVNRRPLFIFTLFGYFVSSFCLGTTFLFATIHSPWVITSSIPFNNPCSTYSRCNDCINDVACGFCYENTPYVNNGTCLPASGTSRLISELGACNSTLGLRKYSRQWAYNYCPISFSWVAVVALSFFLLFYSTGAGQLPFTINSEIYPLWARSTGAGIASLLHFVSLLIESMTFLSFIELIHDYGVFYVMAAVAFVGCIFLFFLLPETKNKSLEEIEELFKSEKEQS